MDRHILPRPHHRLPSHGSIRTAPPQHPQPLHLFGAVSDRVLTSYGTGSCRTCPMCGSGNQIGCPILPKPFWWQRAPGQPPGKLFEIPSKTRDHGRTVNRISYSVSYFCLWICSGNPGANPGDHSPLGSSDACRLGTCSRLRLLRSGHHEDRLPHFCGTHDCGFSVLSAGPGKWRRSFTGSRRGGTAAANFDDPTTTTRNSGRKSEEDSQIPERTLPRPAAA